MSYLDVKQLDFESVRGRAERSVGHWEDLWEIEPEDVLALLDHIEHLRQALYDIKDLADQGQESLSRETTDRIWEIAANAVDGHFPA